jgi:ABC-type branched-subunit amino acid transport system ATPase component
MGISRTFQMAKLVGGMTALENVMSGVHSSAKASIPKKFLRLTFPASPEEKGIFDANESCIQTGMRNRVEIYNLKRPGFSKPEVREEVRTNFRQVVEICYLF